MQQVKPEFNNSTQQIKIFSNISKGPKAINCDKYQTNFNSCLNILFLIFITSFLSCGQVIDEADNEYYTAKNDFGDVSNQIRIAKLDSLIQQLPYWKLSEFKTTEFQKSKAVKILKTNLQTNNLKPNEFIIYEIDQINDSIFIFHLNHIDSFVYEFNLDKLNQELSTQPTDEGLLLEVPPITGNISGHHGWYKVDIEKGNLEINHSQ